MHCLRLSTSWLSNFKTWELECATHLLPERTLPKMSTTTEHECYTANSPQKSTPNDPHSAQLMPHNDPLNGKFEDLLHIQSCKHTEMGREKKSDFTIGATDRRPQVRNQGGTTQGNHNCMCLQTKQCVSWWRAQFFTLRHCNFHMQKFFSH